MNVLLGGGESDATASPPQSDDDDEGSTAATIGSTMRNEAVCVFIVCLLFMPIVESSINS